MFFDGRYYFMSYQYKGNQETTAAIGPMDHEQAEIYYTGLQEYGVYPLIMSGTIEEIQELIAEH